jgi:hypothetical protein
MGVPHRRQDARVSQQFPDRRQLDLGATFFGRTLVRKEVGENEAVIGTVVCLWADRWMNMPV